MQKYVDKTGDVQTAALILSYTGNLQLLYGNPGKQFIFGYRNLLNRWEMYILQELRTEEEEGVDSIHTHGDFKIFIYYDNRI